MDGVLAGRYELEVLLGRGGSGEVWRGRDMATHMPVAVKIVELSQIDDPGMLAETIGRFRREATVISELRHQNIVGALDAGRMANQLFMVMELAPGISLASMMDERGTRGMGLFPVSSVLRIAEQVCVGLAAAHEAGVVHRDIKPSNLMVTPNLSVKIIDFGIVRLLADNSPRLTLPAQTVGTIAYISPEQAQGLDVDGRADLYSLGCVLYQLLSGRPPFFSTLPGALLMMQVMDRATPLSAVRPDLPAGLSELVGDLMEKEPAARPATATEVLGRIAAIQSTLSAEVPEYEADRETIKAGGHRATKSETRFDQPSVPSALSTVFTPEQMPDPPRPGAAGTPPWGPVGPPPWEPVGPPGQPPVPSPVLAQPGPPLGAPPPVPTARGNSVPAWPGARQKPRPRPAWRGVVSTLIAAAIVAGAGVYFWEREHQTLKITHVAVAAANQSVGCTGTTNIVGTISTNGHAGRIKYEWVHDAKINPPLVADDANGKGTVRVTLKWALHVKGVGQAVAELRVLTPQQEEASIIFPYSCPK